MVLEFEIKLKADQKEKKVKNSVSTVSFNSMCVHCIHCDGENSLKDHRSVIAYNLEYMFVE